jgi:RNA polymerase-binding transcription factor DksA
MNEIVTGSHLDELIRRRGQIVMTLRYLENEQRQVEQNTDWLDQAAYKSRVNLLDGLSDWYATEIGQIDKAIERIECNRYGLWSACHEAIAEALLETAPESELCGACQEVRDGLRCL